MVKSPGIPEKAEIVKELRKKNIEIISEIELAYEIKEIVKLLQSQAAMEKQQLQQWYIISVMLLNGLCDRRKYRVFVCKAGGIRTKKSVCGRDKFFSAWMI